MPKYRKVAIVGVGLIGGSIGLTLRQRGLAAEVVGIGRRQASLDKALGCGAVDRATIDCAEGLADAEVVVVATPVESTAELVCRAVELATDTALITDVGSTKALICQEIETRLPEAAQKFVGSHPLAGDHRTGPEHARSDLFEDKTVVTTPTKSTPQTLVAQVESFWKSLGAQVVRMSPGEHDEALAATSHLPHLVASALAAATPEDWLPLAATGWADATRIAAGDPELWTQIFSQNHAAVLQALDRLDDALSEIRTALTDENWTDLQKTLQQAKRIRDALGN